MMTTAHQCLIDEVRWPVVANCLVDVMRIAPPRRPIASRPSATTVTKCHGQELAVGGESGAGAEVEHHALAFGDHSVQLGVASQTARGFAADRGSAADDDSTG